MFGTKELQAKVDQLEAEKAELTTKEAQASEKIQEQEKEIKALGDENKTHKEKIEKLNATNQELTEKVEGVEKKVLELSASQSDFDKKVADAAASKVAGMGHSPVESIKEDDSSDISLSDLQKAAEKATDPEEVFKLNSQILEQITK